MADAQEPSIGRRRFLRVALVGGGATALAGLRPGSAGAAPAAATERRFDHIDGVPLGYWRWKDGSAGRRVVRQSFASSAPFHDRLVRWVRDLKGISAKYGGLYAMDRIITAGAFVAKPGQHGLGAAFDLDQVRWTNGAVTPYAREHLSPDLAVRRRYLGVDAVCRRHFHWVLDGGFDSGHADHLHLDLAGGAILCDPTALSDTAFVQQVLNAFQGERLAVDRVWGASTQRAFVESCRRLQVRATPRGPPRRGAGGCSASPRAASRTPGSPTGRRWRPTRWPASSTRSWVRSRRSSTSSSSTSADPPQPVGLGVRPRR